MYVPAKPLFCLYESLTASAAWSDRFSGELPVRGACSNGYGYHSAVWILRSCREQGCAFGADGYTESSVFLIASHNGLAVFQQDSRPNGKVGVLGIGAFRGLLCQFCQPLVCGIKFAWLANPYCRLDNSFFHNFLVVFAKIVQVSAMKVRFQIAECGLSYAKIVLFSNGMSNFALADMTSAQQKQEIGQ